MYRNDARSRTGALYKTRLERAMHSLKKRETAGNEGRKGEKERKRGREEERNGRNRRGWWRGIATSTGSLSAV